MTTSREFRNSFPKTGALFHETPSNFAKIQPGTYGGVDETIELRQDGAVVIAAHAFSDDVVAFVAGCIRNHPGISPEIKAHLNRFVDAMDGRAVGIHGYSESPKEAKYEWTPLDGSE